MSFHRSFITRALDWYRRQNLDPRLVEPWPSVPEPIRRAPCYDQGAEGRILYQPGTFRSSDELGRFIESSGVHGCIHQEAAVLYGDDEINDLDIAPQNTVFYNIHGMIDRWWRNWEGLGRFREGMPYWSGTFLDAAGEVLRYESESGSWWLGRTESFKGEERVEWGAVGDSSAFGEIADGRPFRIWDTDRDGRLEIVFRQPETGEWWEGSLRTGRLEWSRIILERIGEPIQRDDSLRASPLRKRKIST
ncbi:tyrosinase family protein [Cohnella thailandensis]|uniref:Tyrosinase copper-binding domain-containing protein n=1 Tax=Cohnella thailandensis TaxID=557557 RepID=A0A841SYR7_9BACL|nr:tyrosinase family protein [Cohnella thailandensis]MBB6637353.1 hypothetical protein [Cohnella thailandensis]MBP1976682.1 hypothetical protein [Cohnella thailandensis]